MPLSSITSDFDYLKIISDGPLSITTGTPSDPDFQFPVDPLGGFGSGEQGYASVPHNLGAVPLVRAFIDPGANGLWYSSYAQIGFINIDPNLLTLADTTQVKFCVNSSAHKAGIPVFYRLYRPGTTAFNSDDRIDKIFSKDSTSGLIGAAPDSADSVQGVITVPHNKNEPILWTMQFSQDGSNWYNDGNFIYGPPDTGSGPPGGPYAFYYYMRAYASGDDNNFYLRLEHNYPGARTFFLRWALDYRI